MKEKTNQTNSPKIDIYIAFMALLVSIASIYISWTVYSHQKIIEESDLQIGNPQSTGYSIRFPLVNGYYARYPALIVSYSAMLNGKEITLKEVQTVETNVPKNFRFVEKDKPSYISIAFDEPQVSLNDPLNTIQLFSNKENIKSGKNNLIVKIHYHDFSKKATWTIEPNFEVTIQDGKIIYVDLINVNKSIIKQMNYN